MLFLNFLGRLLRRLTPQPTLNIVPQSSVEVAFSMICLDFFGGVNIVDERFLRVGQFDRLRITVN
jgi:hypothetical protein